MVEKKLFKASDYFKSMDELKTYMESIEPMCTEEEYQALKKILGFGDPEGIMVEVEGIGMIDQSIAAYIKGFNEVGLKTIASCSGLNKDHPSRTETLGGYICFEYNDEVKEAISHVCAKLDIYWNESETYLKPSIYVRFEDVEEQKEIDWRDFNEWLMDYWEQKGKKD